MFGKLVYGQYSLKETFWKFGIFGLFTLTLITKIFRVLLIEQIRGTSLTYYYLHYFSLLNLNGTILFYTAGYFLCLFCLAVYSVMVITGVWKSSAQYDKSASLRQIARVLIFAAAYLSVHAVI